MTTTTPTPEPRDGTPAHPESVPQAGPAQPPIRPLASPSDLSSSQIEDLRADLAYHERMAATIWERLARDPASRLVAEKDACPECGERDADNLVWLNDEDEQVRCSTCDFVYIPPRVSVPATPANAPVGTEVLAALRPLAAVADRYDDNALDEARPERGDNHREPETIALLATRSGRTLLTLADAFNARTALARAGGAS